MLTEWTHYSLLQEFYQENAFWDFFFKKSKFLWDTHPADHEINRLICDINSGTEKKGT